MIGVDTGVLISLFRKDMKLIDFLQSLDDQVVLTRISYLELLFGFDPHNPQHQKERASFDAIFDNFTVLDLDKNAGDKSSEIFWALSKRGDSIGKFDCILAGIYLSRGVTKILTRNVKHFSRIKELEVMPY